MRTLFTSSLRNCLVYMALSLSIPVYGQNISATSGFNDVASGTLNGKGGGTGFSNNWSGSAGGSIVAGDLTSPLYSLTESGTAQHISNSNTTGLRQNYRTFSTALTGEVWFSVLALTTSTPNEAGLSFNPATASPSATPARHFSNSAGRASSTNSEGLAPPPSPIRSRSTARH